MDRASRSTSRSRPLSSRTTAGWWSGSTGVGRGFYSVGLVENFDHPELVVAGIDVHHASHVIDDLVELIRDGASFGVGRSGIEVPGATVSIGGVHPVHCANGLMNAWLAHAARFPDPPDLTVVQVLLEPLRANLRLDRPYTNLGRRAGPYRPRRWPT